MAIIKNTTVTGAMSVPAGPTNLRASVTPTVVNFTTAGTSTWTVPAGVYNLQVLVVGGGGGSGSDVSAGGGAGGLGYRSSYAVNPGDSISYTVGAGGTATSLGNNGADSVFGSIRAYGGGGGAYYYDCQGQDGGSGGGGNSTGPNSSARYPGVRGGGRGVAGQGYPGGGSAGVALATGSYGAGGGGGAGGPGGENVGYGAAGGNGLPFSISGTATWYAGGGAAGASNYRAKGGLGGGGDGDTRTAISGLVMNGAANTGGGGGGSAGFTSGAGGSGIIIVSYVADSAVGQLRYNTEGQTLETSDASGWKSLPSVVNYGSSNALTPADLTNASWTKEGISLTVGQTAPDGSSTAYTMTENSAAGDHRLYWLPAIGNGGQGFFVAQIYVKYTSSLQYFLIRHSGVGGYPGGSSYCYFDLLNRKVTESVNGAIGEIFPEDNGWLRLRVTYHFTYMSGNYGDVVYAMSTVASGGGTNPGYTGNGSRNVQIWKPELLTATDIDANGFRTHIYRNLGGSQYFTPNFNGNVEVLVVGGGGGGASTYDGSNNGNGPRGGGGGGAVVYNDKFAVTAGTQYPVTVGAGGAGGTGNNVDGSQGGDSRFGPLYALGGGAGQKYNTGATGNNGNGGSGGGTAYSSYTTGCQPGAGNMGGGNVGVGGSSGAGGGGGAGGTGYGDGAGEMGGNGGAGIGYNIAGRMMPYGGGGGAGGYPAGRQNYGLGGGIATAGYLQNTAIGQGGGSGGRGGQGWGQSSSIAGSSKGVDYTGGGGGGGGSGAIGAYGGHGIVIVRYQTPTKCAMFLQSGTWIAPPGVARARVLVVAGGGGGGADMGGGGGAGGLLYNDSYPIEAGKSYTVTIGIGGRGAQARDIGGERGASGTNSVFGTMTAIGGGGAASFHDSNAYPAAVGGSGGGASGGGGTNGGTVSTYGGSYAVGTAGQGNNGGTGGGTWYPGGGGGAGAAGTNSPSNGGAGLPFNLLGPMLYFAGGGAGSGYSNLGGNGGLGGGAGGACSNGTTYNVSYQNGGGWSLNWGDHGNNGDTGKQSNIQGTNAGQNTGGGGGGGSHYNNSNGGGNGADGIVIIKWD